MLGSLEKNYPRTRRLALTACLSLLRALLAAPSLMAGAESDEPVYLSDDITPPKRITYVAPEYPPSAKEAGKEGKVILELVVGRKGEVERVKILRPNSDFNEAAVKAVRQWRYSPAMRDGKPVSVYLTVIMEFAMDEKEK